MTIAKVLFIVAILAFITFGGVLAVLSMSRPPIGSFVRRHLRTVYVIQAVMWAAMAVVSLAGESRIRVVMIVLGLVNALIFTSMCFLHPRDSGRVDDS